MADNKKFETGVDFEEPFTLFDLWYLEAKKKEMDDANAMTLSTLGEAGYPDSRMVLLKGRENQEDTSYFHHFLFYTNAQSQKGEQLKNNPKASLCFHWKGLRRQIRIRGDVQPLPELVSDIYFDTRSRGSQIGAWASQQSRPMESRFALEKAIARETARFGVKKISRPEYWRGYYLTPISFEFWKSKPFRLHERFLYRRPQKTTGKNWIKTQLYP